METSTPATPAGSDELILRVAERLRRAASAAPLSSLFAAFIFGISVGQRLRYRNRASRAGGEAAFRQRPDRGDDFRRKIQLTQR